MIMARETKKDRFRRVAEKRVQNILNAVRSLSGLSNKKVYEWEAGQLEKIWKAIEQEIANCKKSFKEPGSNLFKL
jgi:hypothetical protein